MNEYQVFKEQLQELKKLDKKPTLLLHSCCGPCSTHVLQLLNEVFDITVFYYNPNIYPKEEFDKRYLEQQKFISLFGKDVKIVEGTYDYNVYLEQVKGLETLGEFSKRCYNCYLFRLKETFEYAKDNNFDYYTTTLSISPYKNSNWINEIGVKYQSEKTQYLYSNFKKESGYQNSVKLAKEYNLYRQEYCGCEFSIKEHNERMKEKGLIDK